MSCEISVGADCEPVKEHPRPGASWLVQTRDWRYVCTLQLDWCDSMTSRSIPNQIEISSLTLHSCAKTKCEASQLSDPTFLSGLLSCAVARCEASLIASVPPSDPTFVSEPVPTVLVRHQPTNYPSAYVKCVSYSEFVCCTANYKHMYLHFLPCLATL